MAIVVSLRAFTSLVFTQNNGELNVDWTSIEKTAFAQAKGIIDPYKLRPVIPYLFQSLDDFHGVFFYKDSSFKWQKYDNVVSDSRRRRTVTGLYENAIKQKPLLELPYNCL